ncbi:thiamine pyrophosphate-binding protein [Ramlibacter sp. AN1133]|uniref:thiamine pyrophosphate-binding protein n=1 Tax=Ramlibacter sp. AN1133 TaxID=3133429 RepID=UPI0030C31D3F
MKKTGASLVRHALEQLGVRYTFGIPGVHNTEIYDELASSPTITPVRVTHEGGAAFMADAVGRTTSCPGVLLIVPAAGTALAYAGIGEAFLDGIPMLVITGGIHSSHGFRYQLHGIDQLEMVRSVTKARWRVARHEDIVPTLFEAWRIATGGEPGPVFVEVPVDVQLFTGDVSDLPTAPQLPAAAAPDAAALDRAAALLRSAQRPGLFLGWGARDATESAIQLAERLEAPVATTLQGISVFPATHPLHTGMGIGPAAVPAATNAFADRDVLLAIGTRFGEIATGSYGIDPRWKLVHADINPEVFNANYPAEVAIAGDALQVLQALLERLPAGAPATAGTGDLRARIARDKKAYLDEWLAHDSGDRVNPARFFQALRQRLADDAYLLADDGNHTFLTAELFAATRSKHVLSPTDFNCMGYCVPAAIGVKLTHPDQQVVGIVGDGAFLMTGLEILTATELKLGIVYYVFNDGELSQISQAQQLPYNRKTCTVLPEVRFRGIAEATGAVYLPMPGDADIAAVMEQADTHARQGRPVVVDVRIDYSKPTRFTRGIVQTNLQRMAWGSKARLIGRAAWRRVVKPAGSA